MWTIQKRFLKNNAYPKNLAANFSRGSAVFLVHEEEEKRWLIGNVKYLSTAYRFDIFKMIFTLRICLCLQGKLHSGVGTVRTVGLIMIGLHCLFSVLQRHTMVSLVFLSHRLWTVSDILRHLQCHVFCVLVLARVLGLGLQKVSNSQLPVAFMWIIPQRDSHVDGSPELCALHRPFAVFDPLRVIYSMNNK